MKKRVIALLLAVSLIGTNSSLGDVELNVVHADDVSTVAAEEIDKHEHEAVVVRFEWDSDYKCNANITCDKCDFTTTKKCDVTYEVVTEPTCTEEGVGKYTAFCKFNGSEYSGTKEAAISATGHKKVAKTGKEPTCTATGYTASVVCEYCDTIFEPAQSIEATGHAYGEAKFVWQDEACKAEFTCATCKNVVEKQCKVEKKVTEATCTEAGKITYTASCEFQEVTYKDTIEEVLKATGHTEVVTPGKEGTCTENGYTEKVVCETCGVVLDESEIISAKGHVYYSAEFVWYKYEKCTATFACVNCAHTESKTCVITGEVTKEATCTEEGEVVYTAACEFQGKTFSGKAYDSIDKLPHTEVVTKEAKDETCTENGNTEEISCEICGEVLVESEEIEATGHTEIVTLERTEATCTEDGNTEEISCEVCEEVLVESEVIPAFHTYNEGEFNWNGFTDCTVTIGCIVEGCDFSVDVKCKEYEMKQTDATCTEDGQKIWLASCSYDGYTFEGTKIDESYVEPKLGHEYEDDRCIRCEQEKPYAEIVFVKEETTAEYTGKKVALSADVYEVKAGTGEVSFEYYIDEACEIPTYAGEDGKEAQAPVEPGKYYVKAIIAEDKDYKAIDTEGYHILFVKPAKVESLSVQNQDTKIKLKWEKSEEADGYIIYRKKNSGKYTEIAQISKNTTLSYTDGNISQGNKYAYNIAAYKILENGEELVGAKRVDATAIIRTKIRSVTNKNGSVKITWTKVEKAAGYKVYRKAAGDEGYKYLKNIKDSATTTYTDKTEKTLRNGKASYYYVVPYFEEASDVYVKTNTVTNYYVSRPTVSELKATSAKAFKVTWKKNSKATGYEVRYSTSSSFENAKVKTVTSKDTLSRTVSKLTKNKTYYVQVRVYKTVNEKTYYSAWSASKSVKLK